LARLVAAEERLGFSPSPIRRLCAVIAPIDRPKALAILRLSGAQQKAIAMTEAVSDLSTDAALRAAMYWLGAAPVIDHLLIDQPEGWENHLAWARGWAMPSFPLTGKHLIDLGVAPGPQMGALLARVERWWIGEDFRPGRAECLAYLRTLIGSKAM
jgi:poly(A) polymerase